MMKNCTICKKEFNAKRVCDKTCSKKCYRARENESQKLRYASMTYEQKRKQEEARKPRKRILSKEEKERHRKYARERYQNFTEEERRAYLTKAQQYRLLDKEKNANRSREKYQKLMVSYRLCQQLGLIEGI